MDSDKLSIEVTEFIMNTCIRDFMFNNVLWDLSFQISCHMNVYKDDNNDVFDSLFKTCYFPCRLRIKL